MPVTEEIVQTDFEVEIQARIDAERARLRAEAGLARMREFKKPVERTFTGAERDYVTILFGGLTWKHEEMIKAVFHGSGYRCENIPTPIVADFQAGKEFGNNGQCNPTYFTVGNLVRYLQSLEQQGQTKQQIIDNYVFFTAGSCGPCRFGMYESEYRFALQNAGFDGFRVLLFQQTDGIKAASGEPGLKFSVDFGMGMLNALNLGDVLNELVYQVRPFEVSKGETDKVIHDAAKTLTDTLRDRKRWHIMDVAPEWAKPYLKKHDKITGISCTLGKVVHNLYGKEYIDALHACRDSINAIEVDRLRVKPVIKITGEFWAQTTEGDGNFNMFAFLEREGAQVLVEPIATWIAYMMYVAKEGAKARADAEAPYRDPKWYEAKKRLANELKLFKKTGGLSAGSAMWNFFYHRTIKHMGDTAHHLIPQKELSRLAHPFYHQLARGGEGYMKVGKNVYYTVNHLCHMVLALKPFGCMPSTQSDGVQSRVVNKFKDMIFLPIETSGEGEVNAHSRVQMALAEAKAKARAEFDSVLGQTGKSMDDLRGYVESHPQLKHALYLPTLEEIQANLPPVEAHGSSCSSGGSTGSSCGSHAPSPFKAKAEPLIQIQISPGSSKVVELPKPVEFQPRKTKVPLRMGEQRLIIATCEKGAVEDLDDMKDIKADIDKMKEANPNFVDIAAHDVFRPRQVEVVADAVPSPKGLFISKSIKERVPLMERRKDFRIGIPRLLNTYTYAPLFNAYFAALGLKAENILFSDYTTPELYRAGASRGAIDPCYPSKIGITHVYNLLATKLNKKPLNAIWFPMYDVLHTHLVNLTGSNACPTVTATPETVKATFTKESDIFAEHGILYMDPILNLQDQKICADQMFKAWGPVLGLSREENERALETGFRALQACESDIRSQARETLDQLERENRIGIVMLGRVYHHDPGLNHEIMEEFQKLGYPVFSQSTLPIDEDILDRLFGEEVRAGLIKHPLDISDVWKNRYSTSTNHKVWAAKFTARHPNLVALEVSSFKCGHDAPIYGVIEGIIEQSGTPYFSFKDLDENKPSGSIRIRVETIDYFLRRYREDIVKRRQIEGNIEAQLAAFEQSLRKAQTEHDYAAAAGD